MQMRSLRAERADVPAPPYRRYLAIGLLVVAFLSVALFGCRDISAPIAPPETALEQTSVVNPERILAAALDRLLPTSRPPGALAPTGRANPANRKLFLDVVRTTEAFRSIDQRLSPDFSKIGRPFAARTRADAIPCSGTFHCGVDDDGVYAAITSVKAGNAVNSYRIVLLLLLNGRPRGGLHGEEAEMFIRLDTRGEWKVDRMGEIAAIN